MGTTFRNTIVATGVALVAAGCNILDGSPTPKLVVESNGAFSGIYSIDGGQAKVIADHSDFRFTAKVDYEDGVYAQVSRAGSASWLSIHLLEDGERLYERSTYFCSGEYTLVFDTKNRPEVFGGSSDSSIKTGGKETYDEVCEPDDTGSAVPDILTGLDADTVSSSQINISWDDPSDATIATYVVYYVTDESDFGSESSAQQESFLPSDLTDTGGTLTAIITGLTSGTTYYFQVVAVSTQGTSDRSGTETATTD